MIESNSEKQPEEKKGIFRETKLKMTADSSSETIKARRQWSKKTCRKHEKKKPRLLELMKTSFKNDGEIKTFAEEQTPSSFMSCRRR